MAMNRNRLQVALAVAAGTGVLLLAGCHSDPYSASAINSDLTPELMTLTETPADVSRSVAVNWNQNLRNFWMDLGRTFYWDTPSRLSPYDMIPTGGTLK